MSIVKSLKGLLATYSIEIGEFSLTIGKIDPSYCTTKTKYLEGPTWDADDIQNMLTSNAISMSYYKKTVSNQGSLDNFLDYLLELYETCLDDYTIECHKQVLEKY
jgi:hypothetical protein